MSSARGFVERVAEQLVGQLERGTAPWQRPWNPALPSCLPFNPTSGRRYRGANSLLLVAQHRQDPRWLTFNQARATGAHVRPGEKGTPIQYWKFTETRSLRDGEGAVQRSPAGDPIVVEIKLARPRVFNGVVFNGEQITGLPKYEAPRRTWDPDERAKKLFRDAGAKVEQASGGHAFYRAETDTIYLPEKPQYPTRNGHYVTAPLEHGYYATAIHQLAHWTGHESRLARDHDHPFGSVGYAREELRAEIASFFLGHELGVGHDPRAHATYVAAWITILREDPLELFRAATEAEKIHEYILGRQRELEKTPSPELAGAASRSDQRSPEKPQSGQRSVTFTDMRELGVHLQKPAIPEHPANAAASSGEHINSSPRATLRGASGVRPERHYLAVPYDERAQAKAAGASWDADVKCWYARPGSDLGKLARWEPSAHTEQSPPWRDARAEFGAFLRGLGCELDGDHPIMDGKSHRVRTEGDKGREKAGFYVAHVDGVPAGYCRNNRTGEESRWRLSDRTCSPDERAAARASALNSRQERKRVRQHLHDDTARRVAAQLDTLRPVTALTPYLARKGVSPTAGVWTDDRGETTYIPAVDGRGRLRSMQYIHADGTKRFAKNGQKEGCFHPVGGWAAVESSPVIVIAEGYATAATLFALSGCPTIAAFDAGNLKPVAVALRERYPEKPFLFAADDDRRLEHTKGINPGRDKAREAADAVGGVVLTPVFAPGEAEAGLTDFNDLAQQSALGPEAARRQLAVCLGSHLRAWEDRRRGRQQEPEPATRARIMDQKRQQRALARSIGRI